MNDAERDAWLREALRHAPDSDALPPRGVASRPAHGPRSLTTQSLQTETGNWNGADSMSSPLNVPRIRTSAPRSSIRIAIPSTPSSGGSAC